MPDVVFGNIVIVDYHDIANARVVGIDAEGLALRPVHIGLGKAADGVGYIGLLPFTQLQAEGVQEVGFINGLQGNLDRQFLLVNARMGHFASTITPFSGMAVSPDTVCPVSRSVYVPDRVKHCSLPE